MVKAEINPRKNKVPYILWVTKSEEELLTEILNKNDYETLREAEMLIQILKDNYNKGDFKKL